MLGVREESPTDAEQDDEDLGSYLVRPKIVGDTFKVPFLKSKRVMTNRKFQQESRPITCPTTSSVVVSATPSSQVMMFDFTRMSLVLTSRASRWVV